MVETYKKILSDSMISSFNSNLFYGRAYEDVPVVYICIQNKEVLCKIACFELFSKYVLSNNPFLKVKVAIEKKR